MLRRLLPFFLLLAMPLGHAQSWPQRPVRMIVPFAPGGASDLMPRLVGEKLAAIWAQPVIIDNRAGAAGNIGVEAGAKAPPDGYTLLAAPNGNLVVNPHMKAAASGSRWCRSWSSCTAARSRCRASSGKGPRSR